MSLFDAVDEMDDDILPHEASSHLADLTWLARRYYAISLRMHPRLPLATVIDRATDDLMRTLQKLDLAIRLENAEGDASHASSSDE